MVEVDFSGNFLNADNVKPKDKGVFIDEGELRERTKSGSTWKQLVIGVEFAEKKYSHSFKSAEGKRFQELYGKDTKAWIGKLCEVVHIPYVDNEKKIRQGVELIPVEEKK